MNLLPYQLGGMALATALYAATEWRAIVAFVKQHRPDTKTLVQNVAYVIAIVSVLPFLIDADPTPGPGPNPDPDPGPQPVVESPFPPEGKWLLLASEADDGSGTQILLGVDEIEDEPDLQERWHDYDQSLSEEPWADALAYAESKSGGKPYYVARQGGKVSEGDLAGDIDDNLDELLEALEAIR